MNLKGILAHQNLGWGREGIFKDNAPLFVNFEPVLTTPEKP